MVRYLKFILFCVTIKVIVSCNPQATSSKSVKVRNPADIYNPSRPILHPDISIFHLNDSSSIAYVRIFPAELLYNLANEDGILRAKLRLHFEFKKISEDKPEGVFIDSATVSRYLKKADVRNSYVIGLPIKANFGNEYSFKIEVNDVLRNNFSVSYRIVDKTSRYKEQNFNLLSAVNNYPAFSNSFATGEFFKLRFNQPGYDSVLVEYYSLDRTLPRPAFSSVPEIPLKEFPDTSYIYPFNDTIIYELPHSGIYHFKVKFESPDGLTLFNFGENFPKIKSPDDLLGPLVYLTTSAEFRDLRMESNRKYAIDKFWLGLNSDLDLSKELIRVYYNRVLYANLYFTSYKEGWKTDRGMIYIIYGPPKMLEKDCNFEKWIYFSRKGSQTIDFVFNRKENKFTNYDFQLERNVNSSSYWREAIQSWRKGKIYSVETY
jgi:GWxTD domain-containing protein